MTADQLHKMITSKKYKEASEYLQENMNEVFDPKQVAAVYQEVKDKTFLEEATDMAVLITGWCAFFCKDDEMVSYVLERFKGKSFISVYDTSCYAALWAISGYKITMEERLYYAKKAVQVLPQGDMSFCMGNAKYTCAKIAEEAGEHAISVPYYKDSYEIFDRLNGKKKR